MGHKNLNEFLNQPPLTPKVLRTYKGFEDCSDEEVEKIIADVREFCRILARHVIENR